MSVPTFRDVRDTLSSMLHDQGALGVIAVDLAPLERLERAYGGRAYRTVRDQADDVLMELMQQVRKEDLLTLHEQEGDRFLIFPGRKRDASQPFKVADLRTLADRVQTFVSPRLARLLLPFGRMRATVETGYGIGLYSPLEGDVRQVLRLIDEALQSAALRRSIRQRDERETLIEIIVNGNVWTAFQEIVDIHTGSVLGYEALSRGPKGTEFQYPIALFGGAGRHGLTEELERLCRRQAFRDWELFGGEVRLFVNTVPATVRDPSFLGRGVLDYLGKNISPRSVTLEITEGEVIDNFNLYREAMQSFTELGFSFAIDDLGAGYSGLESLATLGASYLKIDMGLVREVHQKHVNQQVVKAIVEMGTQVGAAVIAEGIETPDEAQALRDLGIRFGQGYLWGRPVDARTHKPRMSVAV